MHVAEVEMTDPAIMRSGAIRATTSVRTALADTRFRPAKRSGKAVRQLVAQRFRFKIAPAARPVDGSS